MKKVSKLPLNKLQELLVYDAETGVLYWTQKAFRKHGKPAGYLASDGYIYINTLGSKWRAHRVAYALHYGVDPYPMEIDHINRNRSDNRICNLRAVTASENCLNKADKCNKRNSKKLRICYPDGGVITAKSITYAAYILNTSRNVLRHALHRKHYRVGDTGITIEALM